MWSHGQQTQQSHRWSMLDGRDSTCNNCKRDADMLGRNGFKLKKTHKKISIMFGDTWINISPCPSWINPFVETNWQRLIEYAWGPRRVSSKAAPGTKAYPSNVGAKLQLWRRWIKKAKIERSLDILSIVISNDPEDNHGTRWAAELAARETQDIEDRRIADILARLPELERQRDQARLDKNYALSDSIRDEIESAGVIVKDQKA